MANWQMIDEDKQKDQLSQREDPLLREIKQMKEGAKTREEFVVLLFYRKSGLDSLYFKSN